MRFAELQCLSNEFQPRGRKVAEISKPRKSIMKMEKVKFYATLRGEGLIAALPHTPFC